VNAENKTQKVKLKMANDQMFAEEGTIETIEADFNNETGNIAFRAIFNNNDHILRHGETGNILMPVPLKQALLIPQQATFEVLNKKYVYIVKQDGMVEAREIQVQQEMPHIYVVASGLTVNDAILIEGLRKVKNGDKIQAEKKSFYTILSGLNHLKAE
ncbi:MAG: efflux RND transporter periplasmic adaptor subunit, partial [Bacteroidetes bacterium]|nr:efflux RND transporter periplasmic adaptor subunit [Bacteroidota bacterium]